MFLSRIVPCNSSTEICSSANCLFTLADARRSADSLYTTAVTQSHVELVFAFTAFAVVVSYSLAKFFRLTGLLFLGDFLFTGDPSFLPKKKDGTAVVFKVLLRPASDVT